MDRLLTEEEEAIFQQFLRSPDHVGHDVFLGSGHCTYDWKMLVEEGLPGLRRRVEGKLGEYPEADKQAFLSGILGVYSALEKYMLRYAQAAQERGMEELAGALRRAATETPSDFRAALQLLWIVALVDCAYITPNPTLTVGRMDLILYPLYEKDVRAGRLTQDEARALIIDYYCKHNLIMGRGEHQVGDETNSTTFQRICNFDAPQYLHLAGTDENGHPVANELTQLFAECICPKFKNPVIVVRYFKGLNTTHPELWDVLMEKALASSALMIYNDDNTLKTYARMGIPEEDARRYSHFGCKWPSLGTQSAWMLGGPHSSKFRAYKDEEERKSLCIPYMRTNSEYGWPDDLMIVLREYVDCEDASIDQIYDGFLARMGKFIDEKLDLQAREIEVRQRRPSAVLTFGDCFFEGSIRTAECFAASAKYHFEVQSFHMFGTVVDCITVVDELVFREKKLTQAQLLEAVDANFEGYPKILAMCRNVKKYGSDTPLSNAHTQRLTETVSRMVMEKNKPYLEKMNLYMSPCIQSDTWHLKDGELYGATPDGRRAGRPFSQNIRPANGSCVNGMTAMLNSVLLHPQDGVLTGALNLDVNPSDFQGEEGRKRFGAMLGVYFNRGGLQARVTSVDVNDLIDAQIHPEQHRDLRVRVTGYNGVFVDICKRLQDDIIERLK